MAQQEILQDIIFQDFIVFQNSEQVLLHFQWQKSDNKNKKKKINSFYLRTKLECDGNITDIGQITDFTPVYGIELNSPLHEPKKFHEKNVFPTDLGNQSFEVAANDILN